MPLRIPNITGPAPSRRGARCARGWWFSILADEPLVPRSTVDLPEHEVHRAEDRHGVGDESALQQPGRDLQVVERRPAHLGAERVRALAVADHVDADLALRALDRVVGLALRALPHMTEPRPHRAAGQLIETFTDERDRKPHLTEAYAITRVCISLRVDDRLQRRELGINGVRPVAAQVPVHARSAEHWAGEAISLRELRWDRSHADRAVEEDLVLVEDRHIVLFDVLLIA